MNLPPIIKTGNQMYNQKDNNNKNIKNTNNQDKFGLGIQVFKIQSKKDVVSTQSKGKNYVQRQTIKNIQNPNNNPHVKAPPVPKSKKVSGILPSLNKTVPQPPKEQNQEKSPQIQNMVSKKKLQRQLTMDNKRNVIKQTKSVAKKVVEKKSTKNTQNHNVKKLDKQKENQIEQPQIIKLNYNKQMNSLVNFYICQKQFRKNEIKKLKRRNTEVYGDYPFIEGYCERQKKFYVQSQGYDSFCLDNYMENQGGFCKNSYADFKFQEQ